MTPAAYLFDFDGVIAHTQPIMQQALWKFFREKKMEIAEKEYEEDSWASKSLQQVCEVLTEKHNIHLQVDDLRSQIWETQKALFEAGLESDPTLIPFLEYCKQSGIKVAIGSNSTRERIEWVLKKMGIEGYFLVNPLFEGFESGAQPNGGEKIQNEERGIYGKTNPPPSTTFGKVVLGTSFTKEVTRYNIIGANDLEKHKPDPEVWLKCAEMLDEPIESCLVIEDGLPGLTGAKQCGARSVYYHRFCRPEKACVEIAEKSIESFGELLT